MGSMPVNLSGMAHPISPPTSSGSSILDRIQEAITIHGSLSMGTKSHSVRCDRDTTFLACIQSQCLLLSTCVYPVFALWLSPFPFGLHLLGFPSSPCKYKEDRDNLWSTVSIRFPEMKPSGRDLGEDINGGTSK